MRPPALPGISKKKGAAFQPPPGNGRLPKGDLVSPPLRRTASLSDFLSLITSFQTGHPATDPKSILVGAGLLPVAPVGATHEAPRGARYRE